MGKTGDDNAELERRERQLDELRLKWGIYDFGCITRAKVFYREELASLRRLHDTIVKGMTEALVSVGEANRRGELDASEQDGYAELLRVADEVVNSPRPQGLPTEEDVRFFWGSAGRDPVVDLGEFHARVVELSHELDDLLYGPNDERHIPEAPELRDDTDALAWFGAWCGGPRAAMYRRIDSAGHKLAAAQKKSKRVAPRTKKPKTTRRATDGVRPLTGKQVEAMQIVGECKGDIAEAARRLGKDRKTVAQHIQAAQCKLGVQAGKAATQRLPADRRGQADVAAEDEGEGVKTMGPARGTRKDKRRG